MKPGVIKQYGKQTVKETRVEKQRLASNGVERASGARIRPQRRGERQQDRDVAMQRDGNGKDRAFC